MITAERDLMDGIEQTQPINRMPLEKAEQLLDYEFTKALGSLENNIFIVRVVTAAGKSTKINNLDKVTLAFPTNDLKKEVFGDRELPDTAIMTPELPTFTDDKLNKSIERLYKAGFVKQVHRLL